MTTEEKAKAYDEALKWMRELYPGLHGATKEDAEHYFPELRESEDARIRKWLIDYFSSIKKTVWIHRDITCEQILGWLEKQKEQKPDIEICPHSIKSKSYSMQKEQKPAWSEEDERRIDAICELLENTSAIHPNYSHRKLIIWLKSLRPSWKPNEEQMEALMLAIEGKCPPTSYMSRRLEDLYDGLANTYRIDAKLD